MKRHGLGILLVFWIAVSACAGTQGGLRPDEPVYTFLELPMKRLYSETDSHIGKVFDERFKFYRIYHDKETADPSKREQTIQGKTHFTARPITQYMQVVRIQITPRQEKLLLTMGIERQDVIRAKVRFAGLAPGGSLAFDLLEVLP
ncbi:MAG: hypothetical protein AABY87_04110 [bacterium]